MIYDIRRQDTRIWDTLARFRLRLRAKDHNEAQKQKEKEMLITGHLQFSRLFRFAGACGRITRMGRIGGRESC
ncbi:hypothetical protein ACLKA7_003283 [Drosophila subpalustris]